MIQRDIEKTLQLRGVQIHGENAFGARSGQKIRHQLRSNGNARLVFAILARVSKIGYHRRNALRRSALGGIDHDQQLEQISSRRVCRLEDEDVLPANIFAEFHPRFTVAELAKFVFAELEIERGGDLLRQLRMRSSGKDTRML